jgi:hypothetical protein
MFFFCLFTQEKRKHYTKDEKIENNEAKNLKALITATVNLEVLFLLYLKK